MSWPRFGAFFPWGFFRLKRKSLKTAAKTEVSIDSQEKSIFRQFHSPCNFLDSSGERIYGHEKNPKNIF